MECSSVQGIGGVHIYHERHLSKFKLEINITVIRVLA